MAKDGPATLDTTGAANDDRFRCAGASFAALLIAKRVFDETIAGAACFSQRQIDRGAATAVDFDRAMQHFRVGDEADDAAWQQAGFSAFRRAQQQSRTAQAGTLIPTANSAISS